MEYITENMAGFWFALGFLLMAIEILAFAFGSGVLLFGSLGALIAGGLIVIGVIPASWLASIAAFAIGSAASALVLWIPLKKMQSGAKLGEDRSSDLIGHSFVLASELTRTQESQTRFSGVNWRVVLADNVSESSLAQGTVVEVKAVNAGVFFVDRRSVS